MGEREVRGNGRNEGGDFVKRWGMGGGGGGGSVRSGHNRWGCRGGVGSGGRGR